MILKPPGLQQSAFALAVAWQFLARPDEAWRGLGTPASTWYLPLTTHSLPLAFLPAIGWALGTAIFPITDSIASVATVSSTWAGQIGYILLSVAKTVLLCVVSVVLLAGGIFCIAPIYRPARNWKAAVEVAAYGSSPVLLAGLLMLWPILILVSIIALIPTCYSLVIGLQVRMGFRADEATGCVAIAMVLATLASVVFGALAGMVGLV